jgi:hypothetical protein
MDTFGEYSQFGRNDDQCHLIAGRSLQEDGVEVAAKISLTDKLVIITVYRE